MGTLNERGQDRLNRITEYVSEPILSDYDLYSVLYLAKAIETTCFYLSEEHTDKEVSERFLEIKFISEAIQKIINEKKEYTVELLSGARDIRENGLIKN